MGLLDKKQQMRFFLILLFILGLTACQKQSDTTLHFKSEMVLDYGSEQHPITLIEKIGDTLVTEGMINGDSIILDTFEVKCNDVDTFTVGDYEVQYKTNDTENRLITRKVSVRDLSAPVISFQDENGIELSLEEYKSYNFSDFIKVSDNWKEEPDVRIEVDGMIEAGKTYDVLVTATDKFGNSASKNFILNIKDEPAHEATEEPKQSSPISNSQIINNYNHQETAPPIQSKPQQQPTYQSKPANKQFLFSQGYTMSNVGDACRLELLSSGFGGECIPITDENGIYVGMQLIYY